MVLAPIVALGAALRWSRWPRFVLGIGMVAFFVVLTGAERSLIRAGSREFKPPEPDPPDWAAIDLRAPGPDGPYTD
jgi:hypothetical protein